MRPIRYHVAPHPSHWFRLRPEAVIPPTETEKNQGIKKTVDAWFWCEACELDAGDRTEHWEEPCKSPRFRHNSINTEGYDVWVVDTRGYSAPFVHPESSAAEFAEAFPNAIYFYMKPETL